MEQTLLSPYSMSSSVLGFQVNEAETLFSKGAGCKLSVSCVYWVVAFFIAGSPALSIAPGTWVAQQLLNKDLWVFKQPSKGLLHQIFILQFTVYILPGDSSLDNTLIMSVPPFFIHRPSAAAHSLPDTYVLLCFAHLALSDVGLTSLFSPATLGHLPEQTL